MAVTLFAGIGVLASFLLRHRRAASAVQVLITSAAVLAGLTIRY